MTRKPLAFTLATLLISLVCVTSTPAQAGKEFQRVEKVKHRVNKIGPDENAEVRLMDSREAECGKGSAVGGQSESCCR